MARYRRKEESFGAWLAWTAGALVFSLAAYGTYYLLVIRTVKQMGQDIIESSQRSSQQAIERSRQQQAYQQQQRATQATRAAEIAAAQRHAQ